MTFNAWGSEDAVTKGNILVGDGTRPVVVPVGADDQVATVDATEPTGVKWATPQFLGAPAPKDFNTLNYFSDFMEDVGRSVFDTNAGKFTTPDPGHPGVLRIQTQALRLASNASHGIALGGGVITMQLGHSFDGTLPAGASQRLQFGMFTTAVSPSDNGVYFFYNSSINTNWQMVTSDAQTDTIVDTGVEMSNNGIYQGMKIVINADATSVEYFIDSNSVGVITTDIPATNINMPFKFQGFSWVANSLVDYMGISQTLTNTRI